MIGAMALVPHSRTARMVVSTQVTNAAVQKVWTRLGFEPWNRITPPQVVLSSTQAGALTGKTRQYRLPRAPSH